MQTFLPYPDFKKSIQCLDTLRLGNQRVEAWQIYQTLTGKKQGWINHPATKMWKGYQNALVTYYNLCLEEWVLRGHKNTMSMLFWEGDRMEVPFWLGDENFHSSHRSNLLRKGNEDALWKALIVYEKENGEDDFVLQFPFEKSKMDSFKYALLSQKFPYVKGYYHQFNWSDPINLDYVWPVL
jgi:hypothetical protein